MAKVSQAVRIHERDKQIYRQMLGLAANADLPEKLVDLHVSVTHAMAKLQLNAVGLNDKEKVMLAAAAGVLPMPPAPIPPTAPLKEFAKEPVAAGK